MNRILVSLFFLAACGGAVDPARVAELEAPATPAPVASSGSPAPAASFAGDPIALEPAEHDAGTPDGYREIPPDPPCFLDYAHCHDAGDAGEGGSR